jgi:hypothetical protein
MRDQEVDLLLGQDDWYRPHAQPLPLPMQRNAFHIRHATPLHRHITRCNALQNGM